MTRICLIALILLTVSPAVLYAGNMVYVSSKQTYVYQHASLNSGLMTTLRKDDAVEVLERQGVWLKIRAITITGWVSRYAVSTTKPFSQKVSIFTLLKNFFSTDNKRTRMTLVSTAGGVRGLTDQESDATGKTDFAAVALMESLDISDTEIDEFIARNSD